jgi:hypothetical protein
MQRYRSFRFYLNKYDRLLLVHSLTNKIPEFLWRVNIEFVNECLKENYVNLLYWLETKIYNFGSIYIYEQYAARHGRLEILKHFNLVHDSVIFGAIEGGHLDILKWFHKMQNKAGKKYDWVTNGKQFCRSAAMNNRLDILAWLANKSCNVGEECWVDAICNGYIDIITWMLNEKLTFDDGGYWACCYGQVEILELLYNRNQLGEIEYYFETAIYHNNLNVIKWLEMRGLLPLDNNGIEKALENKHMEIYDYLKKIQRG